MAVSTLCAQLPWDVEAVWRAVTDLEDAAWRSDLDRVERLGPGAFVEYAKDGTATRFTVTREEPCRRWEFDLENPNLRGRWTGEFTPCGGGTQVRFTEAVEPRRWWMRPFVKGYLKRQQARYLADLRRKLGAPRP